MSRVAEIFQLDRKGLDVGRGVALMVVALLPLVVLFAAGQEKYFVSMALGALFVGLCDPGGKLGYRVPRLAVVSVLGALITALGFWLGSEAWWWVVAAAVVVTFLASLAVKYGLHRFSAAVLLNCWFLIALALPASYQAEHVNTTAWAQALAWLIGSALTIAYSCSLWLVRGRAAQPGAELLPGDTTPVPLTQRAILFAVIRAVGVGIAVAIAFGFDLPSADWMPIAALIAMKSSLQQSALVAEQRVAGAVIGAAVAAVFLLTVSSKIALGAVVVVLIAMAGAIRTVNYAWYCAAVAGGVLIAEGLPHPTNLSGEARRVVFTFAGVGIGLVVMLLANLLTRRKSVTGQPRPAHDPARTG